MVCLGARVSLVPDRGAQAYGATLFTVHDATRSEVRSELRGRELERVASRPGETTLAAQLPWSADQVREEVRRIVYDDGDRPERPRWLGLMAGLEGRGVRADDAALAALPFVLEFDDLVIARYGA